MSLSNKIVKLESFVKSLYDTIYYKDIVDECNKYNIKRDCGCNITKSTNSYIIYFSNGNVSSSIIEDHGLYWRTMYLPNIKDLNINISLNGKCNSIQYGTSSDVILNIEGCPDAQNISTEYNTFLTDNVYSYCKRYKKENLKDSFNKQLWISSQNNQIKLSNNFLYRDISCSNSGHSFTKYYFQFNYDNSPLIKQLKIVRLLKNKLWKNRSSRLNILPREIIFVVCFHLLDSLIDDIWSLINTLNITDDVRSHITSYLG